MEVEAAARASGVKARLGAGGGKAKLGLPGAPKGGKVTLSGKEGGLKQAPKVEEVLGQKVHLLEKKILLRK